MKRNFSLLVAAMTAAGIMSVPVPSMAAPTSEHASSVDAPSAAVENGYISQEELDSASNEMQSAFPKADEVASGVKQGESVRVGEYKGAPTYVLRNETGALGVSIGDPGVQERGVCHYAVVSALLAIGVAGVAGLLMIAPAGTEFLIIAGKEIPIEVAKSFVAAGGITSAINSLITAYIC